MYSQVTAAHADATMMQHYTSMNVRGANVR